MINLLGRNIQKFFILMVGAILIAISIIFGQDYIGTNQGTLQHKTYRSAQAYDVTESINLSIYLPFLNKAGHPIYLGVETHAPYNEMVMDRSKDANVSIIRYFGFSWKDIEPNNTDPQNYNWGSVDGSSIIEMSSRGFEIIGTVKFTPYWAQLRKDHACGPIAPEALDDFAQFVRALVKRYGSEPYNIKYWEFGNEPDVETDHVNGDNIFGCWGDQDDEYYGGGYYAEMLKYVYPVIQDEDPHAYVLLGSLLLDCDPENPPDGKDCASAKFFEGILRNGGASYFDFVGFHGYPLYFGDMGFDEKFPAWQHRGGVVLGKADFLRDVMAKYGVNKPLMHTEGSFICPEYVSACGNPGPDFYEAQADYVVWLYVRNIAADIKATIWYTVEGPGWRFGGMLNESQNPKPAYNAFQYLTTYLADSWYVGLVTNYSDPDLRAYEFQKNEKIIWVMWSVDEEYGSNINLPSGVIAVYDKYGVPINLVGNNITIKSPVYVEFDK